MLEKGSVIAAVSQRILRWMLLAMAAFAFCAVLTDTAYAQALTGQQNVAEIAQAAGVEANADLPTVIGRIIYIFLGLLGVILLGILLYAGYLWMTAGGNGDQIEDAKKYIRNAVIGLIIIASSFAITSFILSMLADATGAGGIGGAGGGASGGTFPGRAGSLGAGVIESHVPAPNATNVARNTSIIVTFKVPMQVDTLIQGWTEATSNTANGLNATNIRIYPTGAAAQALQTAQVRVRMTEDRRTFVFKPVELLGSASQNTDYTVELLSGIRRADGRAAFTGSFSSGYRWQFQVSTVTDTTPPKVESVVPVSGQYAPNIVVQVNFNEPVDPTSASGLYRPPGASFPNIQVSSVPISTPGAAPSRPAGEFKLSNQYRTVEFVTESPCTSPVNSCGQQIFCLPSNASITTLLRAATLSTNPPEAVFTGSGYDGIVDLAGNSLDGNGDNVAQGQGRDDRSFTFGTSDRPNLDAPKIIGTTPQAGVSAQTNNVSPDVRISATFDSILRSSTVHSDSVYLTRQNERSGDDSFWWSSSVETLSAALGAPSAANPPARGRLTVNHRVFERWTDPRAPAPIYAPHVLSSVQNIYQNCFVPAGAVDLADPNNPANPLNCSANSTNPNCCDNRAQGASCPFRAPAP